MRAFYNIVFTVLILTSCKTKPTFEAKNQNIVTSQKPNVLLLYMDDLRPEIGAYGSKIVQTPHIDALAKEGLKFTEAYSNVSVCGASRASMLTGIRPTRTQFLNYNTFVEKEQPDAISLPLLFKLNGYNVISNGKIYHHLDDNNTDFDEVYRPYAFDKNDDNLAPTDYWQSLWKDYQTPEHRAEYKQTNTGPAYEMSEVEDSVYIDGLMTEKVIRDIKKLKNSKQPFFLTAGFISPHLPFNAPKKYWDMYSRASIKLPDNNFIPKNAPALSISNWPEMRAYSGIPKSGPVSDSLAKTLIHGYYATVSYTDALIGKIVSALKDAQLYDNTILILVSDHGYNLSEHTQWAKFTTHKISSQVPLIISAPNYREKLSSSTLVELVDVYPTLTDLCHLKNPENQLEGESLVSHFTSSNVTEKEVLFLKNGNGYGLKTKEFGYTEFIHPKTNELLARTLYDHRKDPNETINVAEIPEYASAVIKLHQILHSKFKANLE
jgi:iduronate 2-sulfatase